MKSNITVYIILVFCFAHASLMAQTETISLSHTVGEVAYESKDHRSNVYEVVSDIKTINNNQFQGIIITATDYYPYGSEIGTRSFSGDFKYGFQGQEKDEEVKGKGNSINYKYRMHDARVGRFFTVDPLSTKYPYNSTYAFSENRVLDGVEVEGLEVEILTKEGKVLRGPLSQNEIDKELENGGVDITNSVLLKAHTVTENTMPSFKPPIDFEWGKNKKVVNNSVNSGTNSNQIPYEGIGNGLSIAFSANSIGAEMIGANGLSKTSGGLGVAASIMGSVASGKKDEELDYDIAKAVISYNPLGWLFTIAGEQQLHQPQSLKRAIREEYEAINAINQKRRFGKIENCERLIEYYNNSLYEQVGYKVFYEQQTNGSWKEFRITPKKPKDYIVLPDGTKIPYYGNQILRQGK